MSAEAIVVESQIKCPYCRWPMKADDDIVFCAECHTPHHADCWDENGGCTIYGCMCRTHDGESCTQPETPVRTSYPPVTTWSGLANEARASRGHRQTPRPDSNAVGNIVGVMLFVGIVAQLVFATQGWFSVQWSPPWWEVSDFMYATWKIWSIVHYLIMIAMLLLIDFYIVVNTIDMVNTGRGLGKCCIAEGVLLNITCIIIGQAICAAMWYDWL